MNKLALIACLSLASCASYKVAPSVAPTVTHVSVARQASQQARQNTAKAEAKTKATQAASKGVAAEIDAAMLSLAAHDYTEAARHLTIAKVGHETVMSYLNEVLLNLASANANFDLVSTQLDSATMELGVIQKTLGNQAGDHEIAVRCKSWFGLGALFYGIEHMLKAGIVGILILGALVLAVLIVSYAVGGPVGGLILKLIRK